MVYGYLPLFLRVQFEDSISLHVVYCVLLHVNLPKKELCPFPKDEFVSEMSRFTNAKGMNQVLGKIVHPFFL